MHTIAEVGTYVTRVCFKHGPPAVTGLELEWLLTDPDDPARHPELTELAGALGRHTPRTISSDSPAEALAGGGLVTVEPGGQVEISSAPARSVDALIAAMNTDIDALRALLAPTGFVLSDRAIETSRPPHRILHTPRYDAMAETFDLLGPAGRTMMCSTAALQVCLDLGTTETAADRWRAAHLLGPVLIAAFANSPAGAHQSSRMASWWQLDPVRTLPPTAWNPEDYLDRVLGTPVLARRRDHGPWRVPRPLTLRQWLASGEPLTTADIDLHLSMLFPPVRPQGYLEFRYLDAQPDGEWVAPLALLTALFGDEATVASVLEVCASTSGRWLQATGLGLADAPLRACADQVYELAEPRLAALGLDQDTAELAGGVLRRRLRDGISPAMDRSLEGSR